MKRLIIEIKNGGLGDHLFYSHLPRIAKETGAYDEVFISSFSIFRNVSYKELVWDSHPFIDGFIGEKGIFHLPAYVPENENLLDTIMLLYGLDDGYRYHEPEIFYAPPVNDELKETIIYDPNYISYTGDMEDGKLVEQWFRKNEIKVDYQMKQLNKRYLGIGNADIMETSSLKDFCSVIISAKRIYCLTTGTATLAAAFKIPVTVFYGTGHQPMYRHSKLHKYVHLGSNFSIQKRIRKTIVSVLSRIVPIGTR